MAGKRLIRDYTRSEKVDKLSPQGECMFNRLMLKADDNGSFYGNLKILKSELFPLKDYTEQQVDAWLKELLENDLIFEYTVDNKKFVRVFGFGQRIRNQRNAHPEPDIEILSAAIRSKLSPERNRIELEPELEFELELNNEVTIIDTSPKKGIPSLIEFLDYCSTIEGIDFDGLKYSLQAKYETWREAGWKDGYGVPIKVWKTKIKNAIPYMKPMRQINSGSKTKVNQVDEELLNRSRNRR